MHHNTRAWATTECPARAAIPVCWFWNPTTCAARLTIEHMAGANGIDHELTGKNFFHEKKKKMSKIPGMWCGGIEIDSKRETHTHTQAHTQAHRHTPATKQTSCCKSTTTYDKSQRRLCIPVKGPNVREELRLRQSWDLRKTHINRGHMLQ